MLRLTTIMLAVSLAGSASAEARTAAQTKLLAEGLERRIQELDRREAELEGKPTLAEMLDAAVLSKYASGTKEAASVTGELNRKLAAHHQAVVPIALERTILALRLQAYRDTGGLPDSVPNAEALASFISRPWKPAPGSGSKDCLALDRCQPTPSLELGLPALIKQLDRYHAHEPAAVAAKAPASRLPPRATAPSETKLAARPVARKGADLVGQLVSSLASPDPRRRALAADSLGSLGPSASAAVPTLRRALTDADPRVRASSALALGSVAPALPEIIEDLRRTMFDPNEDVRLSSQTALGRLAAR